MKITLHYQINEMNGEKIEGKCNHIQAEMDDPIFLNMQFCIERNKYHKMIELCKEYKLPNIHYVLQTIIEESEPEQIIDLAT